MANMIDTERLRRQASQLGLEVSKGLAEQLDAYAQLLVAWNQRMNLTALTTPEEIESKHFLDCLMLANQPECAGELVDVGSGAGFPGVVAKLYKPALELTIIEPNGKRLAFLAELTARLGLRAELVKERAEEAARKGWRQSFAVGTARAVAPLRMLGEYCLPLVRPGGCFVAMKADVVAELEEARGAIEKLGARLERVEHYTLPGEQGRSLVVLRKTGETPRQYPRAGGVIKKRPL